MITPIPVPDAEIERLFKMARKSMEENDGKSSWAMSSKRLYSMLVEIMEARKAKIPQ